MKVADLQREAQAKYTDLPIEREDGTTVRLRNLLRLDDTARKSAQVLIKALEKDAGENTEADEAFDALAHQEAVLRDLFLLVADDTDAMKAEIEDWDLPLRLYVLEEWTKTTQPGEASSSAS